MTLNGWYPPLALLLFAVAACAGEVDETAETGDEVVSAAGAGPRTRGGPPMTIEVDSEVVDTGSHARGLYGSINDVAAIELGSPIASLGAQVKVGVGRVTSTGPRTWNGCDEIAGSAGGAWLSAYIGHEAKVPDHWRYATLTCLTAGVKNASITLTSMSTTRAAGSYSIEVEGSGAAAGSHIVVSGSFEVPLEQGR